MSKRRRRPLTDEQRQHSFQRLRIGDLGKVFGHRYGGGKLYQFPHDDAGLEDLRLLADHYAYANPAALPRVIKARAPWLTGVALNEFLADLSRSPGRWMSQPLAEKLGLTEAERRQLKIRTIGSVDMTSAERKQDRKLRDRARKRLSRQKAGAQSRSRYLASNNRSREKPWVAEGISRRTYYRRLAAKNSGTSPSAVKIASDDPGTGPSTMNLSDSSGHTCANQQASRPQQEPSDQSIPKRRATSAKPNQRKGSNRNCVPESCVAGPVSDGIDLSMSERRYFVQAAEFIAGESYGRGFKLIKDVVDFSPGGSVWTTRMFIDIFTKQGLLNREGDGLVVTEAGWKAYGHLKAPMAEPELAMAA